MFRYIEGIPAAVVEKGSVVVINTRIVTKYFDETYDAVQRFFDGRPIGVDEPKGLVTRFYLKD